MEVRESTDALGKEVPESNLTPFLSPIGVWAYGVGTAIGWGSFIVTTNQYLLEAGPLGSFLGMVAGTLIMLVVARSYTYLMGRFPQAGGTYTYAKNVLGEDYGFLCAWFLVLSYLAVFWANVTSLPLFSQYFLGDVFKFGYLYTVFGYDVYLGEALLTMGAIVLVALLCSFDKRLKEKIMVALALTFTAGITICGVASLVPAGASVLEPAMLPDTNALSQVFGVALMTPWAYIGFESVTHSAEEFAFSQKRSRPILRVVVITTAILYILVILLSVSAYPARYDSWLAYLSDLGNLQGIEALPPFYAAWSHMGDAGLVLLMASLLALVITSFIGNVVALSRLVFALSRDGVISKRFGVLNRWGTASTAVRLICTASLVIPFLGRTAIGWIVDITTIGATIVYAFATLSAFVAARREGDAVEAGFGAVGLALMVVLGVTSLVPSVIMDEGLAQETYFLITVWSVLGFLFFRVALRNDVQGVYGKSIVVWTFLLSLVFFSSTVWMQKADRKIMDDTIVEISDYLRVRDPEQVHFVERELNAANQVNVRSSLIVSGMFTLALAMMIDDYRYVRKRQEQANKALGEMREVAYTDALTGVKSKNAFSEWQARINDRIARDDIHEFAVVVCDVNGLKEVNDSLGHAAGDDYIKAAARIVCVNFKHSPVFRIGGDEFVAILEGGDYESREDIVGGLDAQMEERAGANELVIAVGMAEFDEDADYSFHGVFERADARMYERKQELKALPTQPVE